MSRFGDYDGDGDDEFNGNGSEMWRKRAQLAVQGKRGRKALGEIREALMALPDHRLVESVMCKPRTEAGATDSAIVGYDVCIIGARVWYEKVKAGMDPTAAFEAIPRLEAGGEDDFGYGELGDETARIGEKHGLTYTLAWELANMNDESYAGLSPEQRWDQFVKYIDQTLALPPLKAAPRRVRTVRTPKGGRARSASRAASRHGALPMEIGL